MADSKQLSDDTTAVFRCLSHARRRYVLDCLKDAQSPLALADLAKDVAARETDAPRSEIAAETELDVYTALYHSHIPKLASMDFVRYDREQEEVELTEFPDILETATVSKLRSSEDDGK